MAATVGATVRGYSLCPEYSEIFPADTFDFGLSISDGRRTDVDKVMPRWGGVGMACRGPWIRESASVWMEGRKAVYWAGLTRVHSGRPSHNRPTKAKGCRPIDD